MGRWLRVWFALLALFGPAALVPEAQARPAVVSVGGGAPEAQLRWIRPPRAPATRVEPQPPAVLATVERGSSRPLFLLNRALLH